MKNKKMKPVKVGLILSLIGLCSIVFSLLFFMSRSQEPSYLTQLLISLVVWASIIAGIIGIIILLVSLITWAIKKT